MLQITSAHHSGEDIVFTATEAHDGGGSLHSRPGDRERAQTSCRLNLQRPAPTATSCKQPSSSHSTVSGAGRWESSTQSMTLWRAFQMQTNLGEHSQITADLYTESCKTPLRESKDLNKHRDMLCLWLGRLNRGKMLIIFQMYIQV